MSHQVGTVQTLAPLQIGPDSGAAASSPNTWLVDFAYASVPTGTKFLILHFEAVNLPAKNRLEVDLGYDTDVFTSADGASFWTRPVDPKAFAGGTVPIRYVTDGTTSGSVLLDKYGRGERHAGEQDPSALSNCDPFLHDATYVEPIYDPYWFCHRPPDWENSACAPAGDVREKVARSVGMIVTIESNEAGTEEIVSTCSVTLIGPDTVITAGHCHTPEEVLSASVIFNYQTNCDGTRPAGYVGRFYKVVRVERQRYPGGLDYSILQLRIPPGGLPIDPIPLRHDLPAAKEQVFNVSHPNGAVKKLSIPHPGYATIATSSPAAIYVDEIDVSGGSSGSGLFDTSGRFLGILSNGSACSLNWFPIVSVLADVAAMPGEPPIARDVMVVFDRSGSMAADAGTGRTKIEEARDAASLFVELVRAGAGSRLGLVSFSTSASSPVDFALADATVQSKALLVGGPPFNGGVVAGLTPSGTTTIGGGLAAARTQLPAPSPNPRAILLLTDGLQNTPPMIGDVTGSLAGIDLHAIGFGTEANLDGALLSQLAESHHGLYTRAGAPLDLKKFFALAFGEIFEAGALTDPPAVLAPGQNEGQPVTFDVFDEDTITIVVGWEPLDVELEIALRSPSGTILPAGAPNVQSSAGLTWRFLRVPLPQNGEREGTWTVVVARAGTGHGEFGPTRASEGEVRYFVSVIANGGPRLSKMTPSKRYYTGDKINPLVGLGYLDGGWPPNAEVRLTVTRPTASVGEVLTARPLQPPSTVAGDTLPARQATLTAIAQQTGSPAITYQDADLPLYDDPARTGSFEASGVFGDQLSDLFTAEGNYTFHFRASYGRTQRATRELTWSIYIDTGIDGSATEASVKREQKRPDGSQEVTITFIPRDRYGNHVGPGRSEDITVTGTPGTTTSSTPHDNGDGSYTIGGSWDPGSSQEPGVVLTQAGRDPISVVAARGKRRNWLLFWKLLVLILAIIVLVLIVLLIAR
jgi:V8-like Glu-specific endopeptidase